MSDGQTSFLCYNCQAILQPEWLYCPMCGVSVDEGNMEEDDLEEDDDIIVD